MEWSPSCLSSPEWGDISGAGVAGMMFNIGGPDGGTNFVGVSGAAAEESLRDGGGAKEIINSAFLGGLVEEWRIPRWLPSSRVATIGDASGEDGAS